MAQLLRRVWKSVTICPSSSQSNANLDGGSIAPAEQLPLDVFLLILKRLGPRNSARAALVCRAWRSMVADERVWRFFLREEAGEMWEAVLFAETYLRSGFPLRSVVMDVYGTLPFQLIYGQRKQLQGSVIIDGGSGYCKFGQSKYSGPSGRSSTFLEYGNIESPMYSRLRNFFLAIYSRLQVKPSTQPIIISTPICHCDGRLEKELHQALPSTVANGLKVLSPPYGSESAWFGAKIISNMSTYPQVWCIQKKQFRRYGVNAIHALTLDGN